MRSKLLALVFISMTSIVYGADTLKVTVPTSTLPQSVQQIASTGPGINATLTRVNGTLYFLKTKDAQIQQATILNIPSNAIPGPGYQTINSDPPSPPAGGNGGANWSFTFATATALFVVNVNFYYVNGKLVDVTVDVKSYPLSNQAN